MVDMQHIAPKFLKILT